MPLSITEKNERKLEEGMTLTLIFAFNELKKASGETFALMLADTLIVSSLGSENLTSRLPKDYEQISYSYEEEEKATSTSTGLEDRKSMSLSEERKSSGKRRDSKGKKSGGKAGEHARGVTSTGETGVLRTRSGRKEEFHAFTGDNAKLRNHQKELISLKIQEYQERFESGNFESFGESAKIINVEDIQTYKSIKEMPGLSPKEIGIDKKRFAVLFPIEAGHLPVHVSLLKSVSKLNDNPFAYLRFNFFNPSEKFKSLSFPTTPEFFLKELCYRSTDANKMTYILKCVKELQKTFKTVGAKPVSENEDSGFKALKTPILARLKDVKLRPTISGRKTEGHLELYENGVRFISNKSETVDIFFSQVKQIFFQPCKAPTDIDYIIAIHFHCKSPVKVLSRFFDDVQIFVEAVGTAKEIGRDNHSDDEEEEDEYLKKERTRINKEFEEFIKKMESHSGLACDIPFKNLGFTGMPLRGLVLLQPTKSYLINLQDKPFFILCLDEVDFVCFERIYVSPPLLPQSSLSFPVRDQEFRHGVRVQGLVSRGRADRLNSEGEPAADQGVDRVKLSRFLVLILFTQKLDGPRLWRVEDEHELAEPAGRREGGPQGVRRSGRLDRAGRGRGRGPGRGGV